VAGLTESDAASARTVGSAAPGAIRPARAPSSMLRAMALADLPSIEYRIGTDIRLYYNEMRGAMSSTPIGPTPRTTLARLPARGSHDGATIAAILDEALFCHVGFVVDGQPYVIPTIHARVGDSLYVHGSAASRMLRTLAGGVPACVTASLIDGLVMARSAFHHSLNYRSVVVLGTARPVQEPEQKRAALRAIVEHVAPGRWEETRPPSEKETKQTLVLTLALDEASAKIRTGMPIDDEEDYALPCWAGVVPLRLAALDPVPDTRLAPGTPPSAAVIAASRRGR